MSSRKSTRLAARAEAVVAATQLPQKEKSHSNLVTVNDKTAKTTKRGQGSQNLKKKKISNEGASNDNFAYQSNRSRMKGKNANSEIMKDIPLDVLLEIFSLLEPIDLLHLSRVSKGLHDFLTSNDVVFLWKLTYNNVSRYYRPPVCPDETNIVFYTNYLYGRHCQFCSSGLGRIYHESAFIRLCSKCADNNFLLRDNLDKSVRRLCNSWYLNSGYVILKAEYNLRLGEFKHAQNTKGVQSYVRKREALLLKRSSIGDIIAQWRKTIHREHLDKLKLIRYRRAEDIMKRLAAEEKMADWNMMRYRVQQAPHVRKSHALTDSEWSSIRADILDFLQDIRENRAILNMRQKLEGRISHLGSFMSKWKIHPTAWWAASSEPIAAFIKSGASENVLQSKDCEKVEPQLRDVITSWKEETDRYLVTLIPQPSGKRKRQGIPDQKLNALELATTFFKCHWCTEPISYPRILMHGCLSNDVKTEGEAGEEVDEGDLEDPEGSMVVNTRGPREPRPPKEITPDLVLPMLSDSYSLGMCAGKKGVTYDEEASNAARDIINAYGEDPMTVTYVAMEENPARIECLRCSRAMQAKKTKSVRLIMNWIMALVHELEVHYGEPPSSEPAWGKIDSPADLAKVEDAEIKVKKQKRFQNLFSCNHCSWLCNVHLQYLRLGHLTQTHKITADEHTVSNHFTPPVDTPIKLLNPSVKI